MPFFEFVMEGPPVSLNAKEGTPRSRKRYRDWVHQVNITARMAWPPETRPTTDPAVPVTVSCYHTADPPDVDNILKPICDGMKGVVYDDDRQIWKVISQRYDLSHPVESGSILLRSAAGILSEIVHVVIEWGTED